MLLKLKSEFKLDPKNCQIFLFLSEIWRFVLRKKGNIATENSLFYLSFSLILAKFRAKENASPGVHIVLAFRRRAVADGDAFVV